MAGAGYKLFNTGDVLTAAQVNTYLQEQAVMRFASAAARTTALSGVLAEGMVSYLMDTNAVEVYDGSAWVGVATGDITAVTAGTGISGGGTSGAVTITNSMATEITAAGDIIVGTGSGTFDNLPIGTTGQVLTADTTVSPYKVKWATAASGSTFAGCALYKSGNQTISNATDTIVTFDSELFDTDGFHSTATNTGRITIPSGKGGYYNFCVYVVWPDGSWAISNAVLKKNGTTIKVDWLNVGSGTYNTQGFATIVSASVGDYFEIIVYHNKGSNNSILGDNNGTGATRFECSYLGA